MHAPIPDTEADVEDEAALRQAALQRLSYLFRRAGTDTTMQALWRAMVDYRTEK